MAMIIKEAGGAVSTGEQSIVDVEPTALHQRVPVILGSEDNVADLLACLSPVQALAD